MESIAEDDPEPDVRPKKVKEEEEGGDLLGKLPVIRKSDSRRVSIEPGPPPRGRRRSTFANDKNPFDEETLKMFFASHGLTRKDIDEAFEFLSQDKKKLTHGDIKLFVSTYFDWFPEEAMTLLNSWKEEITREQLYQVLLNKTLMTSPYESAFKWFQIDNAPLGKKELKKIARSVSSKKVTQKGDVKSILQKFDMDRDGLIGLEDFKRLALHTI
ncbi:hypothetical protein HDV03_000954 [Kappamyces sp. JEL0829]|nr:hypothetical protein HDV03_000954 [Kappamyces sp. JEL0829]